MLGRFLEIALRMDRPQAAWESWQQLGFAAANAGDIWSHEYGVVCCAGLSLAWHGQSDEPLALCTVRPNVLELVDQLEAAGVPVEVAHLGPDVFNQLTLREPSGVALKVLEARSFTPPVDVPGRTLLGRFESLSLPAVDLQAATAFWNALGYAVGDTTVPWSGVEIDGLPLAYHPSGQCPAPVLIFHRDAQGLQLEPLLDCGLQRARALPALSGVEHQLLRSPGDIDLLLLA